MFEQMIVGRKGTKRPEDVDGVKIISIDNNFGPRRSTGLHVNEGRENTQGFKIKNTFIWDVHRCRCIVPDFRIRIPETQAFRACVTKK
jgi:hypothetical protein